MISRKIYCKPDNGSRSDWELWDGETVKEDYLYSCGEAYVKVVASNHGMWQLKYRLFHSTSKILPRFIGQNISGYELPKAVNAFADWVLENRRLILSEMESYEV